MFESLLFLAASRLGGPVLRGRVCLRILLKLCLWLKWKRGTHLHPPFLLRLLQVNKLGAQDLAVLYEHSGHGGASGTSGIAGAAGIEDQAAAYLGFFGYVGVTVDGYVYGSHGQVFAVLGNNDYYRDYGPDVDRLALFTYEGLKFAVAHYREDLPVGSVDVAINGHTHVTKEAQVGRCLVLNPGSASYPRGTRGPTMARMLVKDGKILSTKFIDLE